MQLQCARCHRSFTPSQADEGHEVRCPECGAEAGLEAAHAKGLPIQLFGALIGCVVLAASVSVVILFIG